MSSPVQILVDTNILLRSIEAGHPMQAIARESVRRLVASGTVLGITAQNLIEFWVVATRPLAANGLGLTVAQAAVELANFKAAFHLLEDTAAIFAQWERIAVAYHVHGKQAHDCRLVGVMKAYGTDKILTFNGSDFSRFTTGEGITIIDPAAVIASP